MKPFAIVISIIIVAVCLVYGLGSSIRWTGNENVNTTVKNALEPSDSLKIDSSISRVTVKTDESATEVTAHLYGTANGFGGKAQLDINRSGSSVSVRAWRDAGFSLFSFGGLSLEVVIPAYFAGDLDCRSSAGSISIDSDLSLKSFKAHSSAGSAKVQNIKAAESITIDSSAGSVSANALECTSADLSSSAGSISVDSCKAGKIRLHSSAGSVSGNFLSGAVDASSSAGPVNLTMRDITGNIRATSSAGGVKVGLPTAANADIDISSSAGSASVNGLTLDMTEKQRAKIKGKLGSGGSTVYLHSSAGPVEVYGN